MSELMLLSNSFSSGLGALEHALATIAEMAPHGGDALFVPYASDDPDTYTDAMHDLLAAVDIRVIGAHRILEPLAGLADCDLVFVGGGNAFRLLRAVDRHGLLTAIRRRVHAGMPYIGVSAGANLACPTLRTTNDMPIVQPASFETLNLIPFQLNPHYPDLDSAPQHTVAARDKHLREFLNENDVPILGLCEGSWLRVRGPCATIGGTAGGRLFRRGALPLDLQPGDDVSDLLTTDPHYDSPSRWPRQ